MSFFNFVSSDFSKTKIQRRKRSSAKKAEMPLKNLGNRNWEIRGSQLHFDRFVKKIFGRKDQRRYRQNRIVLYKKDHI